ncbi:MAG: hypothetical protein ABW168_02610 [Sedimenticola sp.]
MASFKPVSYWKKYRDIKNKVNRHVVAVNTSVGENDVLQSSSGESDDEHTLCDLIYDHSSSKNCPQAAEVVESLSVEDPVNREICNEVDNVLDQNSCEINSDVENTVVNENYEEFFETFPSSDSEFDSDSEPDEHGDLALDLAEWATKFGSSQASVNELLRILRPYHGNLPKDARTLLKTAKVYNILDVAGGSYYHFGICENVKSLILSLPEPIESIQEISIQLNIDGLPLFKSSNTQFWPILGKLVIPAVTSPFIIGLLVGNQKPQDISEYTQQLTEELDSLIQNGITVHVNDVDYQITFSLSCVICDTPARAFVKCCKGHSGYFGCDKCSQRGVWKGKVTFPETNAPRRTDASFDEMLNEEHHLAPSPFRRLPVGMVTQFPLDYMHLVCLGVMRRLIWLWMKGPLTNSCRIGLQTIRLISDSVLILKSYIPREFHRKGRSLFEMERWKATEFRLFLLYTGPIVLRLHLSSAMYKHFLLLFVGILCLSCDFLFETYREYAGKILCLFVQQFGQIYGEDMYVYNVHCLTHLAEDARNFGVLDNFSSFAFESFLGNLKKLVRKPSLPLQQVIRRLSERNYPLGRQPIHSVITAKKKHAHGPVPRQLHLYLQFKEVHLPDYYISVNQGDNCIMIADNVALVRNILSQNEDADKLVVYEKYNNMRNFFTYPLPSMNLRITKVSGLSGQLHVASVSEIQCKCVLLPFQRKFVAFPMIHTFKN